MYRERNDRWKRPAAAVALLGLLLAVGTVLAQNADYERGRAALDRRDWKEAVRAFTAASEDGRDDADAALYWKAYAHHKLNQTDRALASLDELRRSHAGSRWRDDADRLRSEILGRVDRDATANEEMKLAALMSLVYGDPERAVPLLKKFIRGDHSADSQEQALFLLMQTGSSEAMELVAELARDARNPELQESAIRGIGMSGDPAGWKLLEEIFSGAGPEIKEAILEAYMVSGRKDRIATVARNDADEEVRETAISLLGAMGALDELERMYETEKSRELRETLLEAFMVAGDKGRVLAAARGDDDPEVRAQAVQLLGVMGGIEELWTMYRQESDEEVKEAIIEGMAIGGGGKHLREIAMGNDPVELRAAAIEGLGIGGGASANDLIEIYRAGKHEEIVEAALAALMMSGNDKALIELARKEKDLERKKLIVGFLATVRSEAATEYMMELIDE